MIKDFIEDFVSRFQQAKCKHSGETTSASCPYTGKTYTYCVACAKLIKTFIPTL